MQLRWSESRRKHGISAGFALDPHSIRSGALTMPTAAPAAVADHDFLSGGSENCARRPSHVAKTTRHCRNGARSGGGGLLRRSAPARIEQVIPLGGWVPPIAAQTDHADEGSAYCVPLVAHSG